MSPTPTHATQLKCYLDLVDETQPGQCELITQAWGDASVLGFKGSTPAIERLHNLFSNYDPRPKEWDAFPAAPQLMWPWSGLAYIYMTDDRLKATLHMYFSVMIARELGSLKQDGEDLDDRIWEVDEVLVAKLAGEATDAFIANNIRVACFMPEPPQPLLAEHVIGQGEKSEHCAWEEIASAATA